MMLLCHGCTYVMTTDISIGDAILLLEKKSALYDPDLMYTYHFCYLLPCLLASRPV
jgi:hypothetical protein